jgi:hypothetical protein
MSVVNNIFSLKTRIMKSIKLKVFFLALSSLAFSATFAQTDTSHKPKSDTSKMPKHDSTSMIKTHSSGSLLSNNVTVMDSFLSKNEEKVEAKKEEKTV